MSCKCCQHLVRSNRFYSLDPKKTPEFVDSVKRDLSTESFPDFQVSMSLPVDLFIWTFLLQKSRQGADCCFACVGVANAFESFLRQDCLESMTNYVIRSAGRSPVWAPSHIKGLAKNMVLLQMSEIFFCKRFCFLKIVV